MPTIERIYIDTPYDESPDVSYLEQTPSQLGSLAAAVADRRRLRAYERDEWHLIGVRLAADVRLASGQTITLYSPGIWNVESDSPRDYIVATAIDSDDDGALRDDLLDLGISVEEIDAALRDALQQ